MPKNYSKFIPLILPIIVVVGIYIFNNYHKNIEKKQKDYDLKVQKICEEVTKKFDKDNSKIIERDEGIELARRIGYNKKLPVDDLTFKLNPGDFNERNVSLEIASPIQSGTSKTWLGLDSEQTFREVHYFPLATLEKIANEKK